jgi:hypothetical protein
MTAISAPILKEFVAIPAPNGMVYPSYAYPSFVGSELVLTEAMRIFKAGQYRLAKLLGVKNPDNVRIWLKGGKRPSSLYMSRLNMLFIMKDRGVDVSNIREVNWAEGHYTLFINKESMLREQLRKNGTNKDSASLSQPDLSGIQGTDEGGVS